ncbi:MAG: hypothetical protein V7K97_26410 [Nostoc sp.]|uniref:hypothetical protein n=1 Tax=Nostoc sp. TaxID=1180 RepID=UPI002FF58A46
MLTSFTQLFWQRYIQLTHENLQRSLSISTASFVYIVGVNPTDQNANQIKCLDQQHSQLLKSYTTVAHIPRKLCVSILNASRNGCYLGYQLT